MELFDKRLKGFIDFNGIIHIPNNYPGEYNFKKVYGTDFNLYADYQYAIMTPEQIESNHYFYSTIGCIHDVYHFILLHKSKRNKVLINVESIRNNENETRIPLYGVFSDTLEQLFNNYKKFELNCEVSTFLDKFSSYQDLEEYLMSVNLEPTPIKVEYTIKNATLKDLMNLDEDHYRICMSDSFNEARIFTFNPREEFIQNMARLIQVPYRKSRHRMLYRTMWTDLGYPFNVDMIPYLFRANNV